MNYIYSSDAVAPGDLKDYFEQAGAGFEVFQWTVERWDLVEQTPQFTTKEVALYRIMLRWPTATDATPPS
jgi:hypothetical protein